jgi:hypothetical protein
MLTTINPVYDSKYPSEVAYLSDKNFEVRLKAMIERTLKQVGIETTSDKLSEFMDIIGDEAEYCLFEKKENINQPEGDIVSKLKEIWK